MAVKRRSYEFTQNIKIMKLMRFTRLCKYGTIFVQDAPKKTNRVRCGRKQNTFQS